MSIQLDLDLLLSRIAERLQALGLSERRASLLATGQPDAIRYIRTRRAMPSLSRLMQLAKALEADPSYLMGHTEQNDWESAKGPLSTALSITDSGFEKLQSIPADSPEIPVFGASIRHSEEFEADDGRKIVIEFSGFSGQIVDFFVVPLPLTGRESLVGIFNPDGTLDPAFEAGSPILLDTSARVSPRDFVSIDVKCPGQGQARFFLVRRLVGRTKDWITLQQYRPNATFRLQASRVVSLSRVIPYGELLA